MTRRKAAGEVIPPSGVDKIIEPHRYPAVLWEGLNWARNGHEQEWVRIFTGEDEHETLQFMRKCRAFVKSFEAFPSDFPWITVDIALKGYRIRFRRSRDRVLDVEMSWVKEVNPWKGLIGAEGLEGGVKKG